VGDERVGAPELLDTHAAEAFRVGRFGAHEEQQIPRCARDDPGKKRNDKAGKRDPLLALRAVRPPRAVRVGVRDAVPRMLMLDGERMAVVAHAGPWRTDGAWWTARQWAREEWDVEIEAGRCLRLAFDPGAECWYVTGVYD